MGQNHPYENTNTLCINTLQFHPLTDCPKSPLLKVQSDWLPYIVRAGGAQARVLEEVWEDDKGESGERLRGRGVGGVPEKNVVRAKTPAARGRWRGRRG